MDLLNELDKVEESELALFVGVWCVGSTCYLAEILNVEMSLERWGKGSREEERGREERGLRELEDLAPRGARARAYYYAKQLIGVDLGKVQMSVALEKEKDSSLLLPLSYNSCFPLELNYLSRLRKQNT